MKKTKSVIANISSSISVFSFRMHFYLTAKKKVSAFFFKAKREQSQIES